MQVPDQHCWCTGLGYLFKEILWKIILRGCNYFYIKMFNFFKKKNTLTLLSETTVVRGKRRIFYVA